MISVDEEDRFTLKNYKSFWNDKDLALLTAEEAEALYDVAMWFDTDIYPLDIPGTPPNFIGVRIVKTRKLTNSKHRCYYLLVRA